MLFFKLLIKLRISYFAFLSSYGKWMPTNYLLILEKLLLETLLKTNKSIIINLPPRHGKSELISKYFPAFLLSNFKNMRIMLASYQNSFAVNWGQEVKFIIENFSSYYFNIEISKSIKAKGNFKLKKSKGSMYCTGAGGSVTGRGADLLIIDDPVKSDKEALSQKIRENIYNWFQATAFTRIEPDGNIILMMTRWHEDDLAGRLINEYAEEFNLNKSIYDYKKYWIWVNFPAIAEENDQLHRNKGEPLWYNRFNLVRLNEIKNQIGDFWFESLYQQRPAPLKGNIFKREYFRYFQKDNNVYKIMIEEGYTKTILEEHITIYATIDLATSLSEKADYTVIIIFGVTFERDILIIDVIRDKIDPSSHLNLIKSIYQKWEPRTIGIEKAQYQSSLIETAKSVGLPIASLIPDRDKLQRALPMVHLIKEGKVFFNSKSHWLYDFEKELLNFPNSEHDDQVDAFSYILQIIKPITNLKPIGIKRSLEI